MKKGGGRRFDKQLKRGGGKRFGKQMKKGEVRLTYKECGGRIGK